MPIARPTLASVTADGPPSSSSLRAAASASSRTSSPILLRRRTRSGLLLLILAFTPGRPHRPQCPSGHTDKGRRVTPLRQGARESGGLKPLSSWLLSHFCPCRGWGRVRSSDSLPQIRSEEHTSELQSLMRISYAVLCL